MKNNNKNSDNKKTVPRKESGSVNTFKNNNKKSNNNRLMIIIGIVAVLISFIFLLGKLANSTKIVNIGANKYMELFNDSKASVIYISKTSCTYCTKIKPHLVDVANKYDLTIYDIDLDKLNTSDKDKFINSNDFLKNGQWGTPTLMIVKDGAVVDTSIGYVTQAKIEEFLDKNEIIGKVSNEESEDLFTSIDVNKYLELLKGSEQSIVYIGRPSCSYCLLANPILNEIIEEHGININYLNLDEIPSQEEYNKFMDSNEFIKSGQWGTPLLLVVKDNQIVDKSIGYMEKDFFVGFFVKTGMIK